MTEISFFMVHGAGKGHDGVFLSKFADAFQHKIKLSYIPMTFAYMQRIEATGQRRPPPKFDSLVEEFSQQLNELAKSEVNIVAGKSMGGRVATQLSADPKVVGIVCFGFPFHQQGKPEKHRLAFLENLTKPCLIFQGTRDAFGRPEWVNQQTLSDKVRLKWIEGANHDFELLKSLKKSQDQLIEEMLLELDQWLKSII